MFCRPRAICLCDDMSEEKNRGLALSGGGFRATLFHLGVIRYLYDVEKASRDDARASDNGDAPKINTALSDITHITSVSGGSVIAAHLVLNWEKYTNFEDDGKQFDEAADEIISFIRRDVRGRIIRRIPLLSPMYICSFLLRRTFLNEDTNLYWTRVSTTDLLERYYSKRLFKRKKLADLYAEEGSSRPILYLLTTNTDKVEQAAFTAAGLERIDSKGITTIYPYETFPLGRAVAASSAFPGMFNTVSCRPPSAKKTLRLMDGGVYDNLGVKRFQLMLEHDKLEFSEILVSDASVKFRQASARSILEPITTPLRAADILFKRVYDADKKSAEQTDRDNKCSFKFLRLRDKVNKADDKFALLNEHQDHLESIRTDLDRFTQLEIAALIRHGYSVARSKLKYAIANNPNPPWNPLPHTKDKFVNELIARQNNDNAEIISERLSSSAVRKYRFFAYRDWASWLTVFAVLAICSFFLISYVKLAYDSVYGTSIPLADRQKVGITLSASKSRYLNMLKTRRAPSNSLYGGIEAVAMKNKVPIETWTTSQASYALTTSGTLDASEADFLFRSIDNRFLPPSRNPDSDWNEESGCWYTRPSQKTLQADPALWTLAAISSLYRQDNLTPEKKAILKNHLAQVQVCLNNNHFYVNEPQGLAFNVLANQKNPASHSAYNTSLALLALLEMHKSRLTWGDASNDQTLNMINGMLSWLQSRYKEKSGWASVDEDSQNDVDVSAYDGDSNITHDQTDEAANLQIMAIMLEAYHGLDKEIPPKMKERARGHIEALEKNFPEDGVARVFLDTINARKKIGQEISITFLWRQWAIKLCRSWQKIFAQSSADEENELVWRVLEKLTNDMTKIEQKDESDYTFHSAEMLIALS
jgi:predicted acylesterase/phospholipase RssA